MYWPIKVVVQDDGAAAVLISGASNTMQQPSWRNRVSLVMLTVLIIVILHIAGGFDQVIGWQIRGGF